MAGERGISTDGPSWENMKGRWLGKTVFQLFEDVCAKHAERVALKDSRVSFDYRETHLRCLHLARAIRDIHGGKEPVGIALPKSAHFPIAMLAVLANGCPYVPLDLDLPPARNEWILRHSGAKTLIASKEQAGPDFEGPMIYIEDIAFDSAVDFTDASEPNDIAYIIYTSGSTGVPKGVFQNQRNLLHDVMQYTCSIQLTYDDRSTLLYSPSVVGAVRDIYGALLNGASLCIRNMSEEGIDGLADYLREEGITLYHSIPNVLRAFLGMKPSRSDLATVRIVYLAGDRIYRSDVNLFKIYFSDHALLYAAIGSTEVSTIYCQWLISKSVSVDSDPIPLGYSVPDRYMRIVDENRQPVPDGQTGEIVVTSEYISLGYWKDPELTRASFSTAPEGMRGRTFATGDLGRIGPAGMLEFIGRKDAQVKIYGYRVETGEVEARIMDHPGVVRCAVDTVDTESGPLLVALFQGSQPLETTELRESLRNSLPAYMIPRHIVRVDEIPLMHSFKNDKDRIRELILSHTRQLPEGRIEGMPLNTTTEHALAALWTDMLGIDIRHRDADFFVLGGDSLVAMRLAGRVHSVFGVTIQLPDFLSDGRLDRMAARIDALLAEKQVETHSVAGSSVKAGATVSHHNPMGEGADIDYPASAFQELFWRYNRGNPHAPRNPEIAMFRLHGRVDVEALRSAIAVLSRSQPALRTVFFERNGVVYQRVKSHLVLPLVCDESIEPLSESSPDLLAFLTQPFDLETGPLFRFRLVSHGSTSHIFQVNCHHILYDARSLTQMFKELSEYYNALIAGERPEPKARRVSLGELAVEEREWMASEEASRSLDYWMERLDLRGMEHGWPRAGSGQTFGSGRSVFFETRLDAALSERIYAFLGQRRTTMFRFLLGTYFLTLQGLLPGRAVTVSVPRRFRRTEEENELIGCLISTLAVTLEPIRSGSASDRLRLAERRLEEGIRHGRIPWYHTVERWNRLKGVSRNIAPKTHMNFRERPTDGLELDGLRVTNLPVRRMYQPMDLFFIFDANPDRSSRDIVHITGTYKDDLLTKAQVDLLLDSWVSVMRHCTDGEEIATVGATDPVQRAYAFAGGAGGFDEHAKFYRMGVALGEGVRLQVLPDPEASFGLLPGMGLQELAKGYAAQIMQATSKGKPWLVGEGPGAVDAFATACSLQRLGVADVGLILVDPLVPKPAEKFHDHRSAAMEAYVRMPERGSPLQEWLFDIRLRIATRGPLRSRSHPVPKSRGQVFKAALAYGFFDAEAYRERYREDGQATTETLWQRYVADGWRAGRHPSDTFHAYRYEGLWQGFVAGSDEPVLHALLFGMRKEVCRRQIQEVLSRPLERSEITSARRRLRQEICEPEPFRGQLHLVLTEKEQAPDTQSPWQRWVEGAVDTRTIHSPWDESLHTFMDIFRHRSEA